MNGNAFYNYAINGITQNERNPELFDISYGGGKIPLSIFKKDVEDFIRAVIPLENDPGLTADIERALKSFREQGDISGLNAFLNGRAMIIISDFKDAGEYINGGQNGIQLITSLKLDGQFNGIVFDYDKRQPIFKDLYPSNDDEER